MRRRFSGPKLRGVKVSEPRWPIESMKVVCSARPCHRDGQFIAPTSRVTALEAPMQVAGSCFSWKTEDYPGFRRPSDNWRNSMAPCPAWVEPGNFLHVEMLSERDGGRADRALDCYVHIAYRNDVS